MKIKQLLTQMALALLCVSSVVAPIMGMQQMKNVYTFKDRESTACMGCNKPKATITMPCEHKLCQECDEQINDDYNNLSLSSFCPSCSKLYKQGEIVDPQEPELHKVLFEHALTTPSLNEILLTGVGMGVGLASGSIFATTYLKNFYGQVASIITGVSLGSLVQGYFKLKKINQTLRANQYHFQNEPHAANILESRTKAFRNKYIAYSLAYAATPYAFMAVPYLWQAQFKLTSLALLGASGFAFISGWGALIDWGSQYKNIPKLK